MTFFRRVWRWLTDPTYHAQAQRSFRRKLYELDRSRTREE